MISRAIARRCGILAAACTLLEISAGCSTPPPQVISADGVVLIEGKPLASALVRFVPMTRGLPGTWIASGVTDTEGKFTLAMTDQPGVSVGPHKVTVEEAPVPDELRGSQGSVAKYLAGLKLRPIPPNYGSVSQTPLTIEVEPNSSHFELALTRRN